MNQMDEQMKTVVVASLLFLIVSSPFVYKVVNALVSVVGLRVASNSGCPNMTGLLLHTVVFGLVLCMVLKNMPMMMV